jgi:hypothetical protein
MLRRASQSKSFPGHDGYDVSADFLHGELVVRLLHGEPETVAETG